MNLFDERAVHDLVFQACVAAVAEGFPHLAVRDIIEPPHDMFDAALARQVVIHIMAGQFGMPKRRIAILQERNRGSINNAVSIIDGRLSEPAFCTHYRMIAARALELADALKDEAA